jgi:hypothetical protein
MDTNNQPYDELGFAKSLLKKSLAELKELKRCLTVTAPLHKQCIEPEPIIEEIVDHVLTGGDLRWAEFLLVDCSDFLDFRPRTLMKGFTDLTESEREEAVCLNKKHGIGKIHLHE